MSDMIHKSDAQYAEARTVFAGVGDGTQHTIVLTAQDDYTYALLVRDSNGQSVEIVIDENTLDALAEMFS